MLAFYADESGSFDLHFPDQPWVVFAAVGFDDSHWLDINEALDTLKRSYFPHLASHEVEIRSNDIRMAAVRPRPENPFASLGATKLRRFGHELYEVIDALPFSWSAVAIHKPTIVRDFQVANERDLFSVAYLSLVELLDTWCDDERTVGRLFVDQREASCTERRIVRSPSFTLVIVTGARDGFVSSNVRTFTTRHGRTTFSWPISSRTTCSAVIATTIRSTRTSNESYQSCIVRTV